MARTNFFMPTNGPVTVTRMAMGRGAPDPLKDLLNSMMNSLGSIQRFAEGTGSSVRDQLAALGFNLSTLPASAGDDCLNEILRVLTGLSNPQAAPSSKKASAADLANVTTSTFRDHLGRGTDGFTDTQRRVLRGTPLGRAILAKRGTPSGCLSKFAEGGDSAPISARAVAIMSGNPVGRGILKQRGITPVAC